MYSWGNKYLFIFMLVLGVQGLMTNVISAKEAGYYGLGSIATKEEIAGWDIDVRPDGAGLPKGSGSVAEGESIYEKKCGSCHGVFGEGAGRWPKLAGGYDTLTTERPEKTVGSYWPYASTLWDYIHRAMPFTEPQSLSDDETYAVTAYVLYLNDIVDEEFVLTKDNLSQIEMPNEEGFFIDPRPDVKHTACMNDCKDPESIEITSAIEGVTPLQHLERKRESAKKQEAKDSGEKAENTIEEGAAVYDKSCAVCHAQGLAGAPKISDKAAWEKRISQGMDKLIERAINGFSGDAGVMPPKGGNPNLTDEEVTAAVVYMVEKNR